MQSEQFGQVQNRRVYACRQINTNVLLAFLLTATFCGCSSSKPSVQADNADTPRSTNAPTPTSLIEQAIEDVNRLEIPRRQQTPFDDDEHARLEYLRGFRLGWTKSSLVGPDVWTKVPRCDKESFLKKPTRRGYYDGEWAYREALDKALESIPGVHVSGGR